jgi:hypothetical protein
MLLFDEKFEQFLQKITYNSRQDKLYQVYILWSYLEENLIIITKLNFTILH